jgi:antitoxin YefM
MTRVEHVPDADPVRKHADEPRVIRQFVKSRLVEHRPQQAPELVGVLIELTAAGVAIEKLTCTAKRTCVTLIFNYPFQECSMRTVHFTDARSNLKTIIDQVVDDADVTLITRRDAPNAVVMSQEYYDSLMETVYLLKSPANVVHLERSIAQLRKGKVSERTLDEGQ